jgi:gamma-glutamylcyclotransferase (GGCT)/AIG2-like uncharacterized protein YtfP
VDLYFAYGSNMSSPRLRERVPRARAHAAARLRGMRLAINKRGKDGSGKANVVVDGRFEVWGVVYEIAPDDWPILDRFEWGYVRRRDEVWIADGRVGVHLYVAHAPLTSEGLLPFDWYRDHMTRGAREHGLPETVLDELARLPAIPGD